MNERFKPSPLALFFSPHNDDETLFAAYTLQRVRPIVVNVFDGYVQGLRLRAAGKVELAPKVNSITRHGETMTALNRLTLVSDPLTGQGHFLKLNLSDAEDVSPDQLILAFLRLARDVERTRNDTIREVWFPLYETGGHEQHNAVAYAAAEAFKHTGVRLRQYLTYTRDAGKSRGGLGAYEIAPTGAEVRRKLFALAAYESQLLIDELGCVDHFLDLREYVTNPD